MDTQARECCRHCERMSWLLTQLRERILSKYLQDLHEAKAREELISAAAEPFHLELVRTEADLQDVSRWMNEKRTRTPPPPVPSDRAENRSRDHVREPGRDSSVMDEDLVYTQVP